MRFWLGAESDRCRRRRVAVRQVAAPGHSDEPCPRKCKVCSPQAVSRSHFNRETRETHEPNNRYESFKDSRLSIFKFRRVKQISVSVQKASARTSLCGQPPKAAVLGVPEPVTTVATILPMPTAAKIVYRSHAQFQAASLPTTLLPRSTRRAVPPPTPPIQKPWTSRCR